MCDDAIIKRRLDRRRFIKLVTAATAYSFGHTMLVPGRSGLAFGAVGNGRVIVNINLSGGLSEAAIPGTSGAHHDYYGIIYPQNPLVLSSGNQAFHSGFQNIFNWYNQGYVAIVNGVCSVDNTRAHDQETDYMLSGLRQNMRATAAELGIGARIGAMEPSNPLAAVSLSGQDTWSRGNLNQPMDIDNLANGGERPIRWWSGLHENHFIPAREAFFAEGESGASSNMETVRMGMANVASTYQSLQNYDEITVGNTFPNTGIGGRLQDVAKIIIGQLNSPVNTSCFLVSQGGYDTHSNQINSHTTLLTQLDQAVHAFLLAMQSHGLFDRVTVIINSEFGRTKVNGTTNTAGTDHGNGQTNLVIGGNIFGGIKTDPATPAELTGQYYSLQHMRIDAREFLAQVYEGGLGLPFGSIFPDRPSFGANPTLGLFRA